MLSMFKNLTAAQKRILTACFFAFFTNGTMTLMMGSSLPDMSLAYGLSNTQGGMIISGHSIGNMAAGFLSGLVPLLLGRKRSIMTLCLFVVLGFSMMAANGNPYWLLLAAIFTGIGRGSITNFNNATVNRASAGSPVASNLLHCFFAAGAFTAPIVFRFLSGPFGWRVPLFYAIGLAVCAFILYSRMELEDDHPDRKDKRQSTLVFVKNPSFLILAMMMFFYLCSEYSINGWLVTYLQNKAALVAVLGAGDGIKAYSQTMATVLWIVILIGRLTCAALSTKIEQKKLMLMTAIGAAMFFALLLTQNTVPFVTLSVVGVGFCLAGICPMIYSCASPFTNTYPMATSVLLAIGSAGSILMPTIVGAAADKFGFTGGMSSILVTIGLLVVCAVMNVLIKTRLHKDTEVVG